MTSLLGRLLGIAVCLLLSVVNVTAGGLSVWPGSDEDVGEVKWSGMFFTPYFGYEKLKLQGAAKDDFNSPKGWRIGAEAGYDFQLENLVLGVAADGYYTWYEGSGTGARPSLNARLSDYATLRGRLGYAMGRFMVYGTGGLAVGDLSVKDPAASLSDSQMLTGWTAGAGIDWAYQMNLFLRFELAHIALGETTFASLPGASQSLGANLDLFKVTFVSRF